MHKFPYPIQYIDDKIFEIVPLLIVYVVSIVFDFDFYHNLFVCATARKVHFNII